jgi:hypothetical protein
MKRRIGIALIAASWALILSSPAPAAATDCTSLLGTCATDTITIDPEDALDDPVDTVLDTIDGAEDTTDPVVDPVLDEVDDVLGGGGIVDPPGGEGPAEHRAGPGATVSGREGSTDRPGQSPTGTTALVRESTRPPVTFIGSAASGTRPPLPPHGAPGRFDGVIEGAVRGLLLLLVLFGVTIGFVLIQGRLDRNDPRLAGAPVRAEVVTFG